MTLRKLISKFWGELSEPVAFQVVDDIQLLLSKLLDEALTRWCNENWSRASNDENDCTVRVYVYLQESINKNGAFSTLSVQLQGGLPSKEMLAGRASTKRMPFPDLRVCMGETGVSVECKCLGKSGSQREYVYEGIDRFVTRGYAEPYSIGFMIGYVQNQNPASHVPAINRHITGHAAMGPTHRLKQIHWTHRYLSIHARSGADDVRLEHFLPCI